MRQNGKPNVTEDDEDVEDEEDEEEDEEEDDDDDGDASSPLIGGLAGGLIGGGDYAGASAPVVPFEGGVIMPVFIRDKGCLQPCGGTDKTRAFVRLVLAPAR